MNSRQRVLETLNHKEPDKIPVDFGSNMASGMSVKIISKLRDYYGLPKDTPVKVVEPFQMLGEIKDDLLDILGVDCIPFMRNFNYFGFENKGWKEWQLFDGTPLLVPGEFNTDTEEDGSIVQYPQGDRNVKPCARMPYGGYYFDLIVRQENIQDNKLDVEDNLEEFKIISDEELKSLNHKLKNLRAHSDRAVIVDFGGTSFGPLGGIHGPALKDPRGIRSLEELFMSLVTRKEHMYKIFSGQCEIGLRNLEKINNYLGDMIDVFLTSGTDFGTQNGLFVSKKIYIQLYKPFQKKINDWIHENTSWKTFMHNCGSIKSLIPDFIDAGFDILNPVQISANDMDPAELKKEFGKDIVFWGGGIDTQKTLAFCKPKEIREEVKKLMDIFRPNGGFVFGTVHNIQANVPIDNVITMIDTYKSYR
jgi:hypothetical protein